jgi:hypothetical protein
VIDFLLGWWAGVVTLGIVWLVVTERRADAEHRAWMAEHEAWMAEHRRRTEGHRR